MGKDTLLEAYDLLTYSDSSSINNTRDIRPLAHVLFSQLLTH